MICTSYSRTCSSAQTADFALSAAGILGLVVGLHVLPLAGLTPPTAIAMVLLLTAFMLLCLSSGQMLIAWERRANSC